ncbi:ComEA family DNA-binding protein [Longimicrobium sp.]|uniref:ComEA family DNA-binding protein n=1 Tax=Longimicrobium sp. TaxID=2029185 RepID=UPI002C96E0A7|nr:ComEA family DNA-binding protein [Longimicrobium sp.]HSU13495.1 ComEA family DNA-binding protein [Longimicrobium sp.]
MIHTTPQERLALGVFALLVSAGVGARMMHRDSPVELTGPGVEADAREPQLRAEVERRTRDAAHRAQPLAAGERIDPNTAPEEELDRIPKVGPGQAKKIVEWRQAHGAFRSLADLDSVPGIGPAALAAIAPYVMLPQGDGPAVRSAANRPEAGNSAIPPAGGNPAISLNSASAQELTRIPGIGPSLAGRIVAWREGHGAFRSLDELEKVPGIGPATVARIRSSGAAIP